METANADLIKKARLIADSIHVHSMFQTWEIAEKDTLEKCANALEEADEKIADCVAAIDALDDSNDAYIKENERLKKRIAELEAQLPKEGEWIEVHDWLQIPQEERGTYRCSACGQVMKYPWNYCPNCGNVMKGGCKIMSGIKGVLPDVQGIVYSEDNPDGELIDI